MSAALFSGKVEFGGGLSNERELVRNCPPEFNKSNPWSSYAMEVFFRGADASAWKWKEPETRAEKLRCFKALISSWEIKHEDKEAVAGWMLSEMLTEVPRWD